MNAIHRSGRIIISTLFAVFIAFCLMQAASYATDYNSLTGYSAGVGSITVSGGTVAQAVTPVISGDQYTWNIEVTEDWASLNTDKKITITFTKDLTNYPDCEISTVTPSGLFNATKRRRVRAGASLVYEATIDQSTSNGSTIAYVYYDLEDHVTSYKTYVFNITCNGALNPRYLPNENSNDLHVKFGDPAYPDTEPECDMQIVDTDSSYPDNYYSVEYAGSRTGFYPDQLALYVKPSSSGTTVSATPYSGDADPELFGTSEGYYGYVVDLSAMSADSVVQVSDGSETIYLIFHEPAEEYPSTAGTAPTSVVSYLPIGQFATGTGWGTSASKFVGNVAPETTGVSLGAFGGYIEYYFAGGIPNSSINSYGVDFMIYGNAFNGNPEAGAVQVSHDGKTWYELAGSKYYEDGFVLTGNTTNGGNGNSKLYTGTRRNSKVVWTKGTGDTNPDVALYPATGTTPVATFSQFGTLVKYPDSTLYPMGGAHDNTGNMVISYNPGTTYTLTFPGIAAIEDSDDNSEYSYGYCDITPNGSPAKYGTAVNPYEIYTNNKKGGDGFDLEWMTDISTGMPVNPDTVGTIYYVRVYSAVMHNAGVFGETSAEVTGIFLTANAPDKEDVDKTSMPTTIQIKNNNTVLYDLTTSQFTPTKVSSNTSNASNTYFLDLSGEGISTGRKIVVSSSTGTKNYINNESEGTYTYNGQKYIRIVSQQGFKAPYILVLKMN